MSLDTSRPFWAYPQPLKGPDRPYKPEHQNNPAIRGWLLVLAVYVMELIRPVREVIWANAGFSSLRRLRSELEDYEPLHDPTVVPVDHEFLNSGNGDNQNNNNGDDASTYRNLYLSGELTPTDVAKAILPLIRRDIEPKGPHHLYFFESKANLVLQAAEASTQRYRESRSIGPLDGVPCAIKDEYDLDGYKSCLGSANDYTAEPRALNDSITSWCVRKLQEAGVVIVGKTSMHEFGMDTTGNQPIWGTPRNPFNQDYYTGGSSSGTGGAIGLGLIPIGLGSDGGGSIRIPSSYCNIFGLKPTHNRVSFWPSENHSNTCAVLGPMACDVASLAAVFEVIAQPHPASPFGFPHVPRVLSAARLLEVDYAPDRPKVLGVCRAWFDDCAPAVRELCRDMVDRLVAEGGYKVVEVEIPFLKEGQIAHAMTVLTDASTLLPKYDNLTWGNRILLALGRTTPATDYLLAQKLRRCLMMHLSHLWSQHPGMLLVTPTTACAGWRIHDEKGELRYGLTDGDKTIESMRYVWLANFCGLPSISVPAGYASPGDGKGDKGGLKVAGKGTLGKIPVGLMATGEWADEKSLVEFGVEAERVGRETRERPARWVDVVELARQREERE
ncbi:amidase signature enzyme [Cryphonectria parasitica EP155]|uniref:Amidase signature enzyme n=1 Tax=Cryphonectria parasitica (strain ATCC 38755 / EP155) TaxID=660469 RepID=A0A9P4XWB1_CRYP1|nr:amidase signature enzyme [Cryphonectria parasitica EP155]KAF3761760.1 amidase signature enzyme [Cryphonectria parasitica EP155]